MRIIKYIAGKSEIDHTEFHHVHFNIFSDLKVEAHFQPTVIFNYFHNKKLQQTFREYSDRTFENWVETNDGCRFCVLDFQSNVLMQLAHMYRHLMCGGIGLRQVVDFYYLLVTGYNGKYDRWFEPQQRIEVSRRIIECGLGKFASAISYVLKEVFLMDDKYQIMESNENEGKFLLSEMMIGGNFGMYDSRFNNKYTQKKLRNFLYRTYQNFHLMTHYPIDCMWVMIYRVCQYIWRKRNGYR